MPKILVVDDYVVTLRVLGAQLRKGGYDVITAPGGKEAIEQLTKHTIDLAIIDVAMPGMDGISLLKELRSQLTYQSVPIIMLTASVLDEDRSRALEAGATGFLAKPISSWELLDIVSRHMDMAVEQSFEERRGHGWISKPSD